MALLENQIEDLYIWVHPDYCRIYDSTMQNSIIFLDKLKSSYNAGVVELPFYKRPRDYNKLSENVLVRKSAFPSYWESLQKFEELETKALTEIPDRFLIWPFGQLIEGDDEEHLEFLKENFNLKNRKYLFREVNVFGQMPDSCVAHQAMDCRLYKITENNVHWLSRDPPYWLLE